VDPNRFFGWHINSLSLGGKAFLLLLSAVLSGLVGLERQWRGQPAGLRTHILVSLGSTLVTLTSVEFGIGGASGPGDASRLAAQIVSGIGFLGAGAIIREGTSVHGLTTAASIWAVAAIGIAVGSSPRIAEVGAVATLIVLTTLVLMNWLEDAFHLKQRSYLMQVEVAEGEQAHGRLLALLAEHKIVVEGLGVQPGDMTALDRRHKMQLRVRLPGGMDRSRFVALLAGEPSVVSFDLQ
jgi:putative Mg2+ transporter-C (MgtC) family protein